MPRRPNARPTNIYWLIDMRSETISTDWPNGKPFYCGKTVQSATKRLTGHRLTAVHFPTRRISQALIECGQYVRVHVVEVVPSTHDWAMRERSWISILRYVNPSCANVSNGGDGAVGMIHSDESRRKMSIAKSNCKPETRRKLSEYASNRPPDVLAKIGAAGRGRVDSEETRRRRSESHLGLVKSPETCERIRVSKLNQSPETGRKISAAKTGYKYSEEALAAIREGQRKRRLREVTAKIPPPLNEC